MRPGAAVLMYMLRSACVCVHMPVGAPAHVACHTAWASTESGTGPGGMAGIMMPPAPALSLVRVQDEFFVTYHGEPLSGPMVLLVTNALQVRVVG